jgi:hypothetical protein
MGSRGSNQLVKYLDGVIVPVSRLYQGAEVCEQVVLTTVGVACFDKRFTAFDVFRIDPPQRSVG